MRVGIFTVFEGIMELRGIDNLIMMLKKNIFHQI